MQKLSIAKQREIKKELIEKWLNCNMSDDFMFGQVMKDQIIAKRIIKAITGQGVRKIKAVNLQKGMKQKRRAKAIRYDTYFETSKTVYAVEMQVLVNKADKRLPKRIRVYLGAMDLDMIEEGMDYRDLKDAFVIFICVSDPIGEGLPIYVYKTKDQNNQVLNDGTTKIIVNASECDKLKNSDLRTLCKAVNGEYEDNEFGNMLEAKVKEVKEKEEMGFAYALEKIRKMDEKYFERLEMEEARKEGKKEGKKEGRKEGKEEGISLGISEGISQGKIRMLLELGKSEEEILAMSDFLKISKNEIKKIIKQDKIV